jgi:hypothetical protein
MTELQRCAERVAGHIQEPFDMAQIIFKINNDDYSAEQMLHHLLLHCANLEKVLKNPHCVQAMITLGIIASPEAIKKI